MLIQHVSLILLLREEVEVSPRVRTKATARVLYQLHLCLGAVMARYARRM